MRPLLKTTRPVATSDLTNASVRPVLIQRNTEIKANNPQRQQKERDFVPYGYRRIMINGKPTLIRDVQASVSQDNRAEQLRQRGAQKAQELTEQHKQEEAQKEALAAVNGTLRWMFPSTYVGAAYNSINNGSSFTDNVVMGNGFGNDEANLAFDIGTSLVAGGTRALLNSRPVNEFRLANSMNNAVKNAKIEVPKLELNVGWGPKQTIYVVHASNTAKPLSIFSPRRWDVINEGANPHGIWYLGKLGIPRTELTNPGKGVKALAARDLFANRPYLRTGVLTLNKPMATVGDVDRSALSWYADQAGADGIIYNGIYDNGYNANQVIHSFVKHEPRLYRPITFMEKLGIPKGDRGNMSRFLLDALEDAIRKIEQQYPYLDADGNFSWSTTRLAGVVQRMVDMPGARVNSYGKDGISVSWKTDRGFYDFKQDANRRLALFSTKYLEQLPNGEWVGDASMMSMPKDIKMFITSPKAEGGISETVDPLLMKNFWTSLEGVSKSGLYISGDQMTLPLGARLRTTLENVMKPVKLGNEEIKQLTTTRYQDFINLLMAKPVYKTHPDGLSADAYEAILKQASRPNSKYSLRFSSDGMESFNTLTIKNKHIYDLLEQAKSGQIPKELFVAEFNKWVKPYNGMNAKILEDGTIWIPQPFLIRHKQGGKLNELVKRK